MKPLYVPKGKAKEYGDYAINIYTGCPHRCYYCFAPNVLHRDRETFHANVAPRPGLVEALKQQLEKEQVKGQLIHLCFTCDPYPPGPLSKLSKRAGTTFRSSPRVTAAETLTCWTKTTGTESPMMAPILAPMPRLIG